MNLKISENLREEFSSLVFSGATIPQLMDRYSCSRTTIAATKRRWDLVGKTPNSRKVDSVIGTKVCSSCAKEKELNYFYSNGKTPKGTQKYKPTCIVCENSIRKEKYQYNLYSILEEIGKKYLCMDCNITGPYGLLDFHHRDPSKKLFNIGDLVNTTSSEKSFKAKYIEEILKCDILCPTCHRKRHLLCG